MKNKYLLLIFILFIFSFGTINVEAKESKNLIKGEIILENFNIDGKSIKNDKGELVFNIDDNLENKLNLIGFNLNELKEVKLVKDELYNEKKYILLNNNKTVSLTEDLKIKNITNNEIIQNNSAIRIRKKRSLTSEVNEDIIINNIKEALNLSNEYKIIQNEDFDENMKIIIFEKQLSNGVINPYQGVKVFVNKNSNEIQNFNMFDEAPETLEVKITNDEAINISEKIFKTLDDKEIKANKISNLEIIRPNYFWSDKKDEFLDNPVDFVRQAWVINNGNAKVYIDANNGEILGGDIEKGSDHAKAFGHDSVDHSYNSAKLAEGGFRKLGYVVEPTFTTSTSNMRSAVLSYLNKSTSYGFYITCHGASDGSFLSGGGGWKLYPSDIKGNFHLIFLDACNSAKSRNWADAFRRDNPRRSYLGWKYSVYIDPAYKFCQYFWARVGSKPIYNLALDAAASVPGKGSTPIIHYGDKSWYGWAY
ncbi:hypothetical protein [Clostridium perfringens]|uniref:hypothetical protein n=1 Tax=Clostridium perfringens TaxID=1502 RepID=UPI0030D0F918